MRSKLLIVEDEPRLRRSLVDCLKARSYDVESTHSGETALDLAEKQFDLILLDVMLPTIDGFEVCRLLRTRDIHTPVLMLTARGQLEDKIFGLRQGADDYMTKPFEMEELLARVEALLRRSNLAARAQMDTFDVADVHIDFKRSRVVRNGVITELSERQKRLLRYFVERRGEVLSRQELLTAVWGYNFAPLTRTVDVHVALLRQKLGDDPRQPRIILTVFGHGYQFAA